MAMLRPSMVDCLNHILGQARGKPRLFNSRDESERSFFIQL